ncbi:Rv1355c family protein [Taibaiella soli]|uniref:Rv1355c family protein n=1 Tax=Taibaiella soli TaxID=1649169 RepID=A0A2W2C1Y7_9BACT|nr:Rv1355c family protein [Taibaiella soli]PZF74083.1 Rv1355c family protein [Taibaiella soli]
MHLHFEHLKGKNEASNQIYSPVFFQLNNSGHRSQLNTLLTNNEITLINDDIHSQIRELLKIRHPFRRIAEDEYPGMIDAHLNGTDAEEFGLWVYYPWSKRLVHILPEKEFIEVRTSRNQHKITEEEQNILAGKKIGVIGLSVGQSIALTLAMERVGGELRLADFDTAELSNLNRIRTGIHNLGLLKVIMVAREIAEIDPFLQVKIFKEGLQDDNIEAFFGKNDETLDLLVEVCDGLDMKIASRFKAREMRIPVVMDTNDRGMLDIERFDLEPDRPILHGYAGSLTPDDLKSISEAERVGYVLKMIGADTLSPRMKASMMELGQSIGTWPQTASSVVLGGAITTDVVRRILLDQFHESGRYYVDLEKQISDPGHARNSIHFNSELLRQEALGIFGEDITQPGFEAQDSAYIDSLIQFAKEQNKLFKRFPFTFRKNGDKLIIFVKRSEILGNSYLCVMGGMIASFNYKLKLDGKKLEATIVAHNQEQPYFVVGFKAGEKELVMAKSLSPLSFLESQGIKINWAKDKDVVADSLSECERLLHFIPQTHKFYYNYIRFSPQGEGVAYEDTGLPPTAKPVYLMASDPLAIQHVGKWNKGKALSLLAKMRWSSFQQIGLIDANTQDAACLISLGEKLQSLIWMSDAGQVFLNDSIPQLFGVEDFPEFYTEIHLLKQSLITNFETDPGNALFVCGIRSEQ